MADLIQPGRASLIYCYVSGIPNFDGTVQNYHVQEMRLFEDHCKAYFTGELIIEAHQNVWEVLVAIGSEVEIAWEAPRSDNGPTKIYTETYRIYSYASKPREGDTNNAMVITLSIIGAEYYNDKQNTVLQSFANVPATVAAAAIHQQYVAENGGLRVPLPSMGMAGLQQVPHEVNNKKPIKAIHDLLDKAVWAAYPSCACTYFRDKPGYMMAPLQFLLETAPVVQSFAHQPDQASSIQQTIHGYDRIIQLRPQAPPAQDRGGSGGGAIGALSSATSFFDLNSGNYLNSFQSLGAVIGGLTGNFQKIANGMKGGVKGRYGGRAMMSILDEKHQPSAIAKGGPGGYASAEEAFLAALGFADKYWISVPAQTGVNVTCGQRINVLYPFSGHAMIAKTLYVPRLIHELKFTEGKNRKQVTITGTTDIFAVHWGD